MQVYKAKATFGVNPVRKKNICPESINTESLCFILKRYKCI